MNRFPDCLKQYEREFYDAATSYQQHLIRNIYLQGRDDGFPAGYDYAFEISGETTAFSERFRKPEQRNAT